MAKIPENVAIGIDLGSTYSCCSVYRNGLMEMISDVNSMTNSYLTPSVVAFDGEMILVGDLAKDLLKTSPLSTIYDVKRLIGKKILDESTSMDKIMWPFQVTNNEVGGVTIKVPVGLRVEEFLPEEISAMVLRHVKNNAEQKLGVHVTDAVITIPAYFTQPQRVATEVAAQLAGLNVLQLISGPTAAALAYGFKGEGGQKKILVFDLGGGTFDVSILEIDDKNFKVIKVGGNPHLGGQDFNRNIMEDILQLLKGVTGSKNIQHNQEKLQQLMLDCEDVKKKLSLVPQQIIRIQGVLENGETFVQPYTREAFEDANDTLFQTTMLIVDRVLDDAGLKTEDIDVVIPVGGSTKIPKIRELLRAKFRMGERGMEFPKQPNPDEAVCQGAAIAAAKLSGSDPVRLQLLDITPLHLGIAANGAVDWIILDGSLLPCRRTRRYQTMHDNQKDISVKVYQGRRKDIKYNELIVEFEINDINQLPAGHVKLDVTFTINQSGILSVKAVESSQGKTKEVDFTPKKSMTEAVFNKLQLRAAAWDQLQMESPRGLKRKREEVENSKDEGEDDDTKKNSDTEPPETIDLVSDSE